MSLTPVRTTAERSLNESPRVRRLECMTADGRFAAYRSGQFDRRDLSLWTARFPDEVPIVNGEFEWIALDCE